MEVIKKEIGKDKYGRWFVQTKDVDYRISGENKFIEACKYFNSEKTATAYFNSIKVFKYRKNR
mgnify:FL=1